MKKLMKMNEVVEIDCKMSVATTQLIVLLKQRYMINEVTACNVSNGIDGCSMNVLRKSSNKNKATLGLSSEYQILNMKGVMNGTSEISTTMSGSDTSGISMSSSNMENGGISKKNGIQTLVAHYDYGSSKGSDTEVYTKQNFASPVWMRSPDPENVPFPYASEYNKFKEEMGLCAESRAVKASAC